MQFTLFQFESLWNVKHTEHFVSHFVFVLVAKWKKLTAKTVKTRERFKGYDTTSSESSTIPGIELYDVVDGKRFLLSNEKKHS